MEKIFNQKNFNNFIWSPLGSRGNIYINFCLQVHFQVSAAWYCSHYLPPVLMTPVANLPLVSLIPVAICHRRPWHRRQIFACIVDTGGKFVTGVNNTRETGGKICRRCRWYRWQICRRFRWYRRQFATGVVKTGGAPWLVNISVNLGEGDAWKKPGAKNLVTLSL